MMPRYLFFQSLLLASLLTALTACSATTKEPNAFGAHVLRSSEDVATIAQKLQKLLVEELQKQAPTEARPMLGHIVLTPPQAQSGLIQQMRCEPWSEPKANAKVAACIRLNEEEDFIGFDIQLAPTARAHASQLYVVPFFKVLRPFESPCIGLNLIVIHKQEAFPAAQRALTEAYRRLGAHPYDPN